MNAADREPIDVLVVDDDTAVASSTAEILSEAGIAVASATTVEEAAAMMATTAVRSVVLDHSVAAWSVHDFLTPSDARPVVIVVSGLGRDEIDRLRNTYGDRVFAYLAKPVPPRHLIEVVKATLA